MCIRWSRHYTCDDLWALEVLIWVQVTWRNGEVEPHQDQEEVRSPPHVAGSVFKIQCLQRLVVVYILRLVVDDDKQRVRMLQSTIE